MPGFSQPYAIRGWPTPAPDSGKEYGAVKPGYTDIGNSSTTSTRQRLGELITSAALAASDYYGKVVSLKTAKLESETTKIQTRTAIARANLASQNNPSIATNISRAVDQNRQLFIIGFAAIAFVAILYFSRRS